MTNAKTTRRALLSSAIALLLCFAMLLGTTFAWFTDSATSGSNVITSGNLDIVVEYTLDGTTWNKLDGAIDLFQKGLWEPGHTEVVALRIKNNGTLALKYAANMNIVSETKGKTKDGADIVLSDILTVSTLIQQAADENGNADQIGGITLGLAFKGENRVAYEQTSTFKAGNVLGNDKELQPGAAHYLLVKVDMAETVGNEANHNGTNIPKINFGINILATQFTYETDSFGKDYDKESIYPTIEKADKWDGTADTSWYDPENPQTEYTFTTTEQLAGLVELCSEDTTFAGVTFTLANDLDLYCEDTSENADGDPVTFRPIGDHSKDGTFEGTFDGAGHTITNLYQNGWDLGYQWGVYGSYGLFGNVNNATIKNLTISGSESYIEGGDTSFVAGSATGTCVFENITIEDSISATYNNGNGGIIGWSGAGNYTFKDITIKEDCVLAGLWGSFDSSIGGIVGQAEPGATYNFENVNVACRIDAYNDVTAAYKYYLYRMTGMLIGRLEETTTIDGRNYPDMTKYDINCTNVTVNYGDWMNYHYCVVSGKTAWRHEPGYAYGGIPADHDHSTCDPTMHDLYLPFDGLFGGDQYGVNTIKTYEGVTVNYPASYNPEG